MPNEQMSAEEFVKRWAEDECFIDFASSHGAVLRNFARWFMKRNSQLIASTLQAAADRHCMSTCRPKGYGDEDYHCRTCPDRKAILAPLNEKG